MALFLSQLGILSILPTEINYEMFSYIEEYSDIMSMMRTNLVLASYQRKSVRTIRHNKPIRVSKLIIYPFLSRIYTKVTIIPRLSTASEKAVTSSHLDIFLALPLVSFSIEIYTAVITDCFLARIVSKPGLEAVEIRGFRFDHDGSKIVENTFTYIEGCLDWNLCSTDTPNVEKLKVLLDPLPIHTLVINSGWGLEEFLAHRKNINHVHVQDSIYCTYLWSIIRKNKSISIVSCDDHSDNIVITVPKDIIPNIKEWNYPIRIDSAEKLLRILPNLQRMELRNGCGKLLTQLQEEQMALTNQKLEWKKERRNPIFYRFHEKNVAFTQKKIDKIERDISKILERMDQGLAELRIKYPSVDFVMPPITT